MLIYKLFRPQEWAEVRSAGETRGAPVDLADGFIHFSTAEQLRETAEKHFAGAGDLVLVAVETEPLGEALKWEISRGGARFPHLYRPLQMGDVVSHTALIEQGGSYDFPEEIQ